MNLRPRKLQKIHNNESQWSSPPTNDSDPEGSDSDPDYIDFSLPHKTPTCPVPSTQFSPPNATSSTASVDKGATSHQSSPPVEATSESSCFGGQTHGITHATTSTKPSNNTNELSTGPGTDSQVNETGKIIPIIPVSDKDGLYTDATLKTLGFAIFVEYKVLYCIKCATPNSENFGITNNQTAPIAHLKEHSINVKDPCNAQALDSLKNYDAWTGSGYDVHKTIPWPAKLIGLIKWLPKKAHNITKNWSPGVCPYCSKDSPDWYVWTSKASQIQHYMSKHNCQSTINTKPPIIFPFYQSLLSKSTGFLKYFPVDPAITPHPAGDLSDNNTELDYDELGCNLVENIEEKAAAANVSMCPSQGATGEPAVIYSQGWVNHFAHKDPRTLFDLVRQPPTKRGQWSVLHLICFSLFKQYQATIMVTPANV
ncbi:hypothetical protein FRC11_015061 [Ceratobasidium sp. 423]|nr:hypothetical protein FRC11_015061 [Ceratobasidium sp. 423]